jgi:hypothetical protein
VRDVHVFAGPSIEATEVAALLPFAVVHPPVAAGDLLGLDLAAGDIVVIIDGLFLQTRSVRHKEILVLLERGVEVWGCASMGALRGAELHRFGMRTVGMVARLFRMGVLEGDDEVTVLHGDASEGFRPLSEALINIRATVRRLRRARLIPPADAARLVATAASMPFGQRSWERVLRESGGFWATGALAEMRHGQPRWRVDQKRADARRCLVTVRSHLEGDAEIATRGTPVPRTIWLSAWERETVAPRSQGVDGVSDEAALTACRLLGVDYPALQRLVAMRTVAAGTDAGSASLWGSPVAITLADAGPGELRILCELVRPVARDHGLLDEAVQRRWLTAVELLLDADERLARIVGRTFWTLPCVPARDPVVAQLRASGALDAARERVVRARDVNRRLWRRDDRFAPHRLDFGRVGRWFVESWGATEPSVDVLADRGFTSIGEVVGAGRELYAYARTEGRAEAPLSLLRRDTGVTIPLHGFDFSRADTWSASKSPQAIA